MSRILKVNTKDKLRALLTDVLPYELPLWFSNFYMYTCLAETKVRGIYETVSGKKFDKWDVPLIPLTYLIYRSENKSPRAISIMHPVAQFQVCEFYSKYEDIIEYYCTRSQHSLRYPYRVASRFYGKAQKGRVGTVGVETVDEEPVVASSYFKYKQHAFLHQFFESYDYHRLEKKFPSMLQVDIAKCFPSIYTHSIGWAVKGKRLAKTRSHGSFDVDFDRLMQLTNYKETNGIIVGPEVCRIFAEVILQKIDINLVAVMNKKGWDVSKHYDFRRYVDDYFVFYSSEGVRSDFVHVLESCLLEYKMYLNEAKTVKASRPFATEISLAKSFLRREVEEYFCARFANNDAAAAGIIDIKEPGKRANQSISALKMAMARCHVEYSSVSNFLMAAIVTKSKQYLSMVVESEIRTESQVNWLLVDLDVLFFIHAMDMRIRPTDRLARFISDLLDRVSNWNKHQVNLLRKKIFDSVKQAIDIFELRAADVNGLETLNLLIILTMLPEHRISFQRLKRYYNNLKSRVYTPNDIYFRWVSFMAVIKDDSVDYPILKEQLINEAQEYFVTHEDMFADSQYYMFYFDYMACPYIDQDIKREVMKKVKSRSGAKFNTDDSLNFLSNRDFVFGWRDKDYLKNSLQKREYIFPYS